MNKGFKAFTLVELIVVITIIAILGTIAFISLQGYSSSARNSRRISDINNIKTSLELFILNSGVYPTPDNYETVSYGGDDLRYQGVIGDNVTKNLSKNLPKKPTDPLYEIDYTYSTTNTKKEYELLAFYEGTLSLTSPQPSPTGEGVITKLFNQANASTNVIPKILGNYNQLYVKSANYIVPTPSIINAEVNGTGMILNENNIKSQILTEGENIPNVNIGGLETQTGKLEITLSVYTGSITKESTSTGKILAIEKIQQAYSGTTLSNNGIYKYILGKTSEEEKLGLAETVLLNNNFKFTTNDEIDEGGEEEVEENICTDITNNIKTYWKFDDFSLDDNFDLTSINTNRWTLIGNPILTSGGQISINLNDAGIIGLKNNGWILSGDFDVQVDFNNFIFNAPSNRVRAELYFLSNIGDWSNNITIRRESYQTQYRYQLRKEDSEGQYLISPSTTVTSGQLRIIKVGNTVTFYSGDLSNNWTSIGTTTFNQNTINEIGIRGVVLNSGNTLSVKFDNFKINKGEILSDNKNINNGYINGAVWGVGKIGNALLFNGTTNNILVNDNNNLTFSDGFGNDEPFTISTWLKFTNISGEQHLLSKFNNSVNYEWILRSENGNIAVYQFNLNSNVNRIGKKNNDALSAGQWYNIVYTYDGTETEGGMNLYINGEKIINTTSLSAGTYTGFSNSIQNLYIGAGNFNGTLNGFYNGEIDDTVIFDKELNQDEITKIYNDGLSGNTVCGY